MTDQKIDLEWTAFQRLKFIEVISAAAYDRHPSVMPNISYRDSLQVICLLSYADANFLNLNRDKIVAELPGGSTLWPDATEIPKNEKI